MTLYQNVDWLFGGSKVPDAGYIRQSTKAA